MVFLIRICWRRRLNFCCAYQDMCVFGVKNGRFTGFKMTIEYEEMAGLQNHIMTPVDTAETKRKVF